MIVPCSSSSKLVVDLLPFKRMSIQSLTLVRNVKLRHIKLDYCRIQWEVKYPYVYCAEDAHGTFCKLCRSTYHGRRTFLIGIIFY